MRDPAADADTLRGRLAAAERRLEEARAELATFARTVSHDLGAPLRSIEHHAARLEELAHDRGDEGSRHLLELRVEVQRVKSLLDDLVAYSRVVRAAPRPRPVELRALLSRLLDEGRARAPERSIQIEMGDLPDVQADPALLEQALRQIVDNALKFTRPRAVARIRISAESLGHGVRLRVEDDGVGFDGRFTHKLFHLFERLHYPDEFEGNGIGLALVRRITELHGGEVEIEGHEGEGAVVHLTLPAAMGEP